MSKDKSLKEFEAWYNDNFTEHSISYQERCWTAWQEAQAALRALTDGRLSHNKGGCMEYEIITKLKVENLGLQVKLELAKKPLYSRRQLEAECERYKDALEKIIDRARQRMSVKVSDDVCDIAKQALTSETNN